MNDKEFNIEKKELKSKELLIIRVSEDYTPEELNNLVQHVSRTVNEGVDQGETYVNPVLFVDKNIDLQSISISELENILEHAKSLSEDGNDAQEEIELTNPSSQQKQMDERKENQITQSDINEMHEDLKELIPNQKR